MVRGQQPKIAQQAIAWLLLMFLCPAAWAADKKPPVPVGADPGGVKVAIIGAGIDYTQPEVASRLARDGEGEIIGWDFIDDDRRPFARGSADAPRILLSEGQSASLVVVAANFAEPLSIARALRYAAQGPARIIAVQAAWTNVELARILAEAARYFPNRLFIVGAGDDNRDLDADDPGGAPSPPRANIPANVIIAAAAQFTGEIAKRSNSGARTVDLAIDATTHLPAGEPAIDALQASPSQLALARLAALAARLVAVAPELDGAALKARICALARRVPGAKPSTKAGFIGEPWKPYWLE